MVFSIGHKYVGEAIELRSYGAILKMEDGSTQLLHISNIANEYIQDVSKYIEVGKKYEVTAIPGQVRAVELTLKHVDIEKLKEEAENMSFDQMLEMYLPKPDYRDKKKKKGNHRRYNKEKNLE